MSPLMACGAICLSAWEVPLGLCPPLPFYLSLFALCHRNAEKILGYLHTNILSRDLIPPHVNFSHLTAKDYTEMYKVIRAVKEDRFASLGLDPCLLEDELDKVWDRLPFPAGVGRKSDVGTWDPEMGLGWLELSSRPQKAAWDAFTCLRNKDELGIQGGREERDQLNPCPEVGWLEEEMRQTHLASKSQELYRMVFRFIESVSEWGEESQCCL